MNTGQGQPAAGGQAQATGQAPTGQHRTPMYQPNQIRSLPLLSDEEKTKYEQGLHGLWTKMNNSPTNSPDQIAARTKIIEFSRMLVNKIQQRRTQHQAQQLQGQTRPTAAQQNNGQAAVQGQQPKPQKVATSVEGSSVPKSATTVPATTAPTTTATAAAIQRTKIPDHLIQHVNKMHFRPPLQLAEKSSADATKWVEEMKERYARALMTMESAKNKVAAMDKMRDSRMQAGKPFNEDEQKKYQTGKDQQLKFHTEAHKWVETIRKQQEMLGNGSLSNGAATPAPTQKPAQAAKPNSTPPVNAALEAAKAQQQQQQQQQSLNRPTANTPSNTQAPNRPGPAVAQAVNATAQGQQHPKQEHQVHPTPVNTALASATTQAQAQALGAGRVPTPQTATPVTAAGAARALSHSAAMSLANQRVASNTPGSATIQNQQQNVTTPASTGINAMNNTAANAANQQQQAQGHPHAHPSQPQAPQQSRMPIQKQLPEKATAIPQGVTIGGGVATGRPTMSQGSGTLGGVMNQPAVARIPAYSHDAEGDHVLSKKKLDELVRQVCGATSEGQDGNLLTPEVEESVLNLADSFVDNVLHSACRNSKERGSKVLEIRDIQLVLERTYNIRVPGYSSDELRTVRKVQPSQGWISKMSAVQAAKVMPSKTE